MKKLIVLILIFNSIYATAQVYSTEAQRLEVANRLANGWSDPDGDFPDIVARVKSRAAAFRANPIASRYSNADTNVPSRTSHPNDGALPDPFIFTPTENHNPAILYPFDAAKKGWALKDATDANALFDLLHWITQQPEFDFGDTVRFPRSAHSDQFPYVFMGIYFKQWITWYADYIKLYETTSTSQEVADIDTWISAIGDWSYEITKYSIGKTLGSNWTSVQNGTYAFTSGWSNTKPTVLFNSQGNQLTQFTTTDGAAFIGNNRIWGVTGLCHVAAIYNKDQAKRNMVVQMFKNYFKWSIFTNGIPMEVDRNRDTNNPSLFFGYFYKILQELSEIAFREEVLNYNRFITENAWRWESLFEYTTIEGGINGKVTGNEKVWNGSSTSNSLSEKGLLLFANAGINFWDGTFNYYTSGGNKITGIDKKFPIALGIINSYHNNQRLEDAEYLTDSAGMPTGAPTTPSNMPTLSGVFGSINFPLGYIGMGGKIFTSTCSGNNIIPEYRLNGTWKSGNNILKVNEGAEVVLSMLPNTIALESLQLPDGTIVGDNFSLGNVTSADNGSYILTSVQGCTTTILLSVEDAGTNTCPNSLDNDASVQNPITFLEPKWEGGSQTNQNLVRSGINFDPAHTCALKVQTLSGGAYTMLRIPFDLAANGIDAGDILQIDLNANNVNGNPRIDVVPNNDWSNKLVKETFPSNTNWSGVSKQFTVPQGATQIFIRLYANYDVGNSNPGFSVYDNLKITKVEADNICPDNLDNDASVQNPITFLEPKWEGGSQTNQNLVRSGINFDPAHTCALKVQTLSGGAYTILRIPFDLAANGIDAGDILQIDLNANNVNGNPRIDVVPNNDWSHKLVKETFPVNTNWSGVSKQFTVPQGATQIFIRLYANNDVGINNPGFSVYDNLSVTKVALTETSLKASIGFGEVLNKGPIETIKVFPNPATEQIQVELPTLNSYQKYSLYALNGSLVKEGTIDLHQKSIHLIVYDLVNGIYLLNLSNDSGANALLKILKE